MAKKQSLRERLIKKNKALKKGNSNGKIIFLKEGTIRVRVLPVGEENEFVKEVTQFYLGNTIKGVFSPSTIGKPCALLEAYNELKNGDDDEKELAKSLIPKTKYLLPVLVYEDLKGKKVDKDKSGKMVQLTKGLYQSILDLYLDEDEWGDMTDPKNGYDIKLIREGTGMTDTEYSVQPCKNTPLPKKYNKVIDLDEMVESVLPSYEETVEKKDDFLGLESTPLDNVPKRKKGKGKKRKGKKRKKRDLN